MSTRSVVTFWTVNGAAIKVLGVHLNPSESGHQMTAGASNFGRFRLDLERRELTRDGHAVGLGSRALDILIVLAEAKGELVSKDTLLERVWPNLVVEENNLHVHVSAIRKALEGDMNCIVTVPGRGYRLVGFTETVESIRPRTPAPTLPDNPSLAVLPFHNISGDPEQDYFVDGLVEEIITTLSRVSWFFVIARNSSFTYKGKATDVRQVGRELGVRYVLEGSVRKAEHRVRITGQLIEAETGYHVWADRFDGTLDCIFELQDRITESVVAAIEPSVQRAEIARANAKPTTDLSAYDLYLRAQAKLHRAEKREVAQAVDLLRKAIEIDPEYVLAKGSLSWLAVLRTTNGWADHTERERGIALAREVLAAPPNHAHALADAANGLSFLAHDYSRARQAAELAVQLNPRLAHVLTQTAWVFLHLMDAGTAIDQLERAIRLNPRDPEMHVTWWALGYGFLIAGRNVEAVTVCQRAVHERPGLRGPYRALMPGLVRLGRIEEARAVARKLMAVHPSFQISNAAPLPFSDPAFSAEINAAARLAGVPD